MRSYNELADVPYSEMSEEEINYMVEARAAELALTNTYQQMIQSTQEHLQTVVNMHMRVAAESKARLQKLVADSEARVRDAGLMQ